MQNIIEDRGLSAAADALDVALATFKEADQTLHAALYETTRRITEDTETDAARAAELKEEGASATGITAVLLERRAADLESKNHGMTDEERAMLDELKTDAEDKLNALRIVRKQTAEAAQKAKERCEALYSKAVKIDVQLYENWISTEKFEKTYGRIR